MCTFGTFRGLRAHTTVKFTQASWPLYKAPSHTECARMVGTWQQRLQGLADRYVQQHGPWALLTDGATVRRRPYLNVLLRNAYGEEVFLVQQPTGNAKLDAHTSSRCCSPSSRSTRTSLRL